MNESLKVTPINRENFQYIRDKSGQDLENAQKEYASLKKEHIIPYTDVISTALPNIAIVLLILFDPKNLYIYLIFWIIASLILLMCRSTRSIFRKPPKLADAPKIDIRNPDEFMKHLTEISKDKKGKTLFLAFGKMFLTNLKPFAIAFSFIYFLNMVILLYFYVTNFDFGVYTIIIFILSLALFIIFGLMWHFKNYAKDFPESLLNMETSLKNVRDELNAQSRFKRFIYKNFITVFGIIVLITVLTLIFSPFILTVLLLIHFEIQISTHFLQFFVILIGQYLIVLVFEVYLTRYYVLKWLDSKIFILKSNVITPIDAILSNPTFFTETNLEEIQLKFKLIRFHYLKSMLYLIVKIDLFGFFVRRLLLVNLNLIQNDEDFKILEEYFEKELIF
jgi:hypothetical protein